jgi:hypothetical protein
MCKLSPVDDIDMDLLVYDFNEFKPCGCHAYSVEQREVYAFEADPNALSEDVFDEQEPVYILHKTTEWQIKPVCVGTPEYVVDMFGKVYRVLSAHIIESRCVKKQLSRDELRVLQNVWERKLRRSFKAERRNERNKAEKPAEVIIENDLVRANDMIVEVSYHPEFPGYDPTKRVKTETPICANGTTQGASTMRRVVIPECKHKRGNGRIRFCDLWKDGAK